MTASTCLRLACLLALILAPTLFPAWSQAWAQPGPRIGLVLGGGGARGTAHVGVLEVLDKLRVPVHCVAGTSMGSLVAGAWLGGLTPPQMLERMGKVDWHDLFEDDPSRSEINYRERRLAQSYYPALEAGVTPHGLRVREMAPGLSLYELQAVTAAPLLPPESGEPA